jgi:hypothetical protein
MYVCMYVSIYLSIYLSTYLFSWLRIKPRALHLFYHWATPQSRKTEAFINVYHEATLETINPSAGHEC